LSLFRDALIKHDYDKRKLKEFQQLENGRELSFNCSSIYWWNIATKKKRDILRGLLESIFKKKDKERLFSVEQRRIYGTPQKIDYVSMCKPVTWADFSVDHIKPFAKGGQQS